MKQDSYNEESYVAWLDDPDTDLNTRQQCQLLDGYFETRENMPGKTVGGRELTAEPKSTGDIINDCADMYPLDTPTVVKYMQLHEFGFTTIADGSVKWAVWRDITPIQV